MTEGSEHLPVKAHDRTRQSHSGFSTERIMYPMEAEAPD